MIRSLFLLLIFPMLGIAQTPLAEQWTQKGNWIKTLCRGNNCKAVIKYAEHGNFYEEIWLGDVKLMDLTRQPGYHRLNFTNIETSLIARLVDYDENGSFECIAILKRTGEKVGIWGELENLIEVFELRPDGTFQQVSDAEFRRHKEDGAHAEEIFRKNPKGGID